MFPEDGPQKQSVNGEHNCATHRAYAFDVHNSRRTLIEYGIQLGYVLYKIPLSVYNFPLGVIFRILKYHYYADDTQFYGDFTGTQDGEASDVVDDIEQ